MFLPVATVCLHQTEQLRKRNATEGETTGNKKGKVFPVTGRGGPQGCETSRLPHFLNNRLTDGGEIISFTLYPSGREQGVSEFTNEIRPFYTECSVFVG
jgi:hypothetical protein